MRQAVTKWSPAPSTIVVSSFVKMTLRARTATLLDVYREHDRHGFVATIAAHVLHRINQPAFLAGVRARGEYLRVQLERLAADCDAVVQVRGALADLLDEVRNPVSELLGLPVPGASLRELARIGAG